jgi:hypothetical protein
MAIVNATITVDFTANYAGTHRVCYRVQGSGNPYDCTTLVSCVGGGNACQALIIAPVNTTSCDGTVVFEGYIQAICEDILSTNGRLAWTADFVPNQVCDKFNITCDLGPVTGIPLTDRGELYDVGDTIVVTRDGGDAGAVDAVVSIASVGDGVINSISALQAGGLGYAPGDTIQIAGATGAGGLITVDTVNVGPGDILTYTLTNGGSGYTGFLTFNVTSGGGAGAAFEINPGGNYAPDGSLTGFTIINGGEYSIQPTVSIVTGTGSNAVFDLPPLGGCAAWTNVGADCIGGTQVDILDQTLEVGSTFSTCLVGGLQTAIPSTYTVDESGCCITEDSVNVTCTDHHIDNVAPSVGPVDVHITNCGGDDEILSVPLGTTAVCLVTGGYIDPFVAGVTITDQGTSCT